MSSSIINVSTWAINSVHTSTLCKHTDNDMFALIKLALSAVSQSVVLAPGGRAPLAAPAPGSTRPAPMSVLAPAAGLVTRKGCIRGRDKGAITDAGMAPTGSRPCANSVPAGQACTQCFAQA